MIKESRAKSNKTISRKRQLFIAVVAILLVSTAQVGADEVLLNNGDKLSGRVLDVNSDRVILEHEVLGTLTLDQNAIQTVKREHPEPVVTPPSPPALAIEWEREIEAGYDLARGNTKEEQLSGRVSAHRKTDHNDLTLKANAAKEGSKTSYIMLPANSTSIAKMAPAIGVPKTAAKPALIPQITNFL